MSPRAAPTWVLLVVLTLVPTLGMAGFAGREARISADAAARAQMVEEGTADLVRLMEVLFAITQEQVPAQAIASTAPFGVSPDQASEILGFDLVERRSAARTETTTALMALPDRLLERRPALRGLRSQLTNIRVRSEAPEVDPAWIQDAFGEVAERVLVAFEAELARLQPPSRQLADRRVEDALRGLAAIVDTSEAGRRETFALAAVLFSLDDQALRTLAADHEAFEQALAALEMADDPIVREAASALQESATIGRVNESIEATLADPTWLVAGALDETANIFLDIFQRSDLLADMAREAGRASTITAKAAEESARADNRRTLAISGGVGFLAFYLAFMVSWSISRPLHLLARRAGAVTDGRLGATMTGGGGPREVQVVAHALDAAAGNLHRVEVQARALADGALDADVLLTPVPGPLGESVHASVEQLSRSLRDQEELRLRLAHQASHDSLSGLLNRAGCLVAIEQALARPRPADDRVALLFIDLDGFKRANDNFGHSTGDEVLRITGQRLVDAVRPGDTVARLGGDEFVVIVDGVPALDDAVRLAEALITAVSEPIEIDGKEARIGASIGAALDQAGHDALELLREADQAVFLAKRSGRNRVEVFDDVLRQELAERVAMEDALRAGMAAGELELHYQPVVDTLTGRLQGFEALARWNRPDRGVVPPVEFIPVAEACDLVVDLGRWVLKKATMQLVTWSSDPAIATSHVSVNISGRHLLNKSVVDDVRAALAESGLHPSRLVVEITETVILSDMAIVVKHLSAIRDLGVRVALDDFGTGYTSIGQLGHLPIDILKIDRAFVMDLHQHQDRSIVELMVEVAHTLGLGLVAEGVEDDTQLRALQRLSCDDVQGFLIARPLHPRDIPAWAASAAAALERVNPATSSPSPADGMAAQPT